MPARVDAAACQYHCALVSPDAGDQPGCHWLLIRCSPTGGGRAYCLCYRS